MTKQKRAAIFARDFHRDPLIRCMCLPPARIEDIARERGFPSCGLHQAALVSINKALYLHKLEVELSRLSNWLSNWFYSSRRRFISFSKNWFSYDLKFTTGTWSLTTLRSALLMSRCHSSASPFLIHEPRCRLMILKFINFPSSAVVF